MLIEELVAIRLLVLCFFYQSCDICLTCLRHSSIAVVHIKNVELQMTGKYRCKGQLNYRFIHSAELKNMVHKQQQECSQSQSRLEVTNFAWASTQWNDDPIGKMSKKILNRSSNTLVHTHEYNTSYVRNTN